MFTLNNEDYCPTRECVCYECFSEIDDTILGQVKECANDKKRKFEDIGMHSIRIQVDPYFNLLHDSLEVAYYKYWREGMSKKFLGFNKSFTKAGSKNTFDKMHGALWFLHMVVTDKVNQALPLENQHEYNKWWASLDEEGNVATDLVVQANEKLLTLKEYAVPMIDALPDEFITQEDMSWQ